MSKYLCVIMACILTAASAIAGSWSFPECWNSLSEANSVWQCSYVDRSLPTDHAVSMDKRPGEVNPSIGGSQSYFVGQDPYACITSAFMHPGDRFDPVLTWKSCIKGVVTITIDLSLPQGDSSQGIRFQVDRISSDEAKSFFERQINHQKSEHFVVQIPVKKDDRIAFRIGAGSDGITSDATEIKLHIAADCGELDDISKNLISVWKNQLKSNKPLMTIPLISIPPNVDGVIGNDEWEHAAIITNFINFNTQKHAAVPTTVYLAYDMKYIYVGFDCGLAVPLTEPSRTDGQVWRDNSIELYFRPDYSSNISSRRNILGVSPDSVHPSKFYQFVGNSRGDYAKKNGQQAIWKEYKASCNDSHWQGEIKISFSDLGISAPKNGEQWAFNVCRNNPMPFQEFSQWSKTFMDFFEVPNWGTLKFGELSSPVIQCQPIIHGSTAMPVKFNVASSGNDKINELTFLFDVSLEGETVFQSSKVVNLSADENQIVEFSGQPISPGNYNYRVIIGDKAGTEVFGVAVFPVDISAPFNFSIKQYPTSKQMKIVLDNIEMSKSTAKYARIKVTDVNGNNAFETAEVKITGDAFEIPVKCYADIGEGEYIVCCELEDANKGLIGRSSQKFTRPNSVPEWVRNKDMLGSTKILPPGFSALKVNGNNVICWNRTYSVSNQSTELFSQIENNGEAILAGPITVIVGKEDVNTVVEQELTWETKKDTFAAATRIFKSDSVHFKVKTQVEFDGFSLFELSIYSDQPKEIDQLFVEIPIRKEYAKYLVSATNSLDQSKSHTFGGVGNGLLPNRDLFDRCCSSIWLGNDDVGINWVEINHNYWQNADEKKQIEILHSDDSIILRLRLIDTITKVNKSPLEYTFGLMATPVKPYDTGSRTVHYSNTLNYGDEIRKPEPTNLPKTLTYTASGNLSKVGTLELWVTFDFDPCSNSVYQNIFTYRYDNSDIWQFGWNNAEGFVLDLKNGQKMIGTPTRFPKKGELCYVALTWDENGSKLYVDGMAKDELSTALPTVDSIPQDATIMFGHGAFGVDEFRVSSVARHITASNCKQRPEDDNETLLLDHLDDYFQPIDYAYPREQITSAVKMSGRLHNGGGIVSRGCSFLPGHFKRQINLTPGLNVISMLDKMKAYGLDYFMFHEWWSNMNSGVPLFPEKLKSLIAAAHEVDIKVTVYFGFLLSDAVPEYDIYRWEVLVEANKSDLEYVYKRKWDVDEKAQLCYYVCYGSHWRYYVLDQMRKLLKNFDVDGFYLDQTAYPILCDNQSHGCGFDKNGKLLKTTNVLETREMMQRMYTLLRSYKPDGKLFSHGREIYGPSQASFVDVFLGGEIYRSLDWRSLIDIDHYRAQYMARQWGLPFEFITWDTQNWCLSYALLHDNAVHAVYPDVVDGRVAKLGWLWKAQEAFEINKAKFYPYWENGAFLKVSGDAKASFYINEKGDIWLAVSQFGSSQGVYSCQFDKSKFKVSEYPKAYDIFTGETIEVTEGKVELQIEPWKPRVLIIEKRS